MKSYFYLIVTALFFCCASQSTAQNLHKKEYLDQLKSYDSKSSLAPAEMKKARELMLAIMNEGRSNPNYRKLSGCKGDLNLASGLNPLALDDRLNAMAQEQADYMAANDILTHDNKNYKDFGVRKNKHLGNGYGPEGCGQSTTLADFPINFMKSETHYREVWNLGAEPTTTVGFGMAKSKTGYWYIATVWGNFPVSNNNTANTKSVPANVTLCGTTTKFQGSMTPGSSLSEKEALVSANGRYRLRYDSNVGHVIEEVLNSNNCQFKQVYSFAGIIAGQYIDNNAKNQAISFNYESNGDILLTYPRSSGRFSKNAASPDKHRDAPQVNIVGKSTKLELTNEGKLRLVNNSGQEVWGTTPATPACGLTIKYQGFMTPGSLMLENEVLVSANGRYQFRNSGGSYVIEEILNRNNCQFKQVYDFTLVVTLMPPHMYPFNGSKRGFSYTKDGDIIYIPNVSVGVFSENPKNPSKHRDSPKTNVVGKSTKLELTNEGILRLVNNNGQVIWTTTGHDK